MANPMADFPHLLKRLRGITELNQAQLAERVGGVSQTAISNWENSKGSAPNLDHELAVLYELGKAVRERRLKWKELCERLSLDAVPTESRQWLRWFALGTSVTGLSPQQVNKKAGVTVAANLLSGATPNPQATTKERISGIRELGLGPGAIERLVSRPTWQLLVGLGGIVGLIVGLPILLPQDNNGSTPPQGSTEVAPTTVSPTPDRPGEGQTSGSDQDQDQGSAEQDAVPEDDGETVETEVSTTSTSTPSVHPLASSPGRECLSDSIDLETADIAQLALIRGLDSSKAQLIVDYRSQNGMRSFKDLETALNSDHLVGEILVDPTVCFGSGANVSFVMPSSECGPGALDLNSATADEMLRGTRLSSENVSRIIGNRPYANVGEYFELSPGPSLITRLQPSPACLAPSLPNNEVVCHADSVDLAGAPIERLNELGVLSSSEIEQLLRFRSHGAMLSLLDLVLAIGYPTAGEVILTGRACFGSVSLDTWMPAECGPGQFDVNAIQNSDGDGRMRIVTDSVVAMIESGPYRDISELAALARGESLVAHLAVAGGCISDG